MTVLFSVTVLLFSDRVITSVSIIISVIISDRFLSVTVQIRCETRGSDAGHPLSVDTIDKMSSCPHTSKTNPPHDFRLKLT